MPTNAESSNAASKRALDTPNATIAPTTKKSKSTSTVATDPNAPKRAKSAFILFSQAERDNVKREHPTASNTELYKRLGEKWRDADADTKARYDALYRTNKAEADEAIRAYAAAQPKVDPVASTKHSEPAGKSTKKATDPNAPKRAKSAFILFSQAERDNVKREHPTASNTELFKRLGEKWLAADADTKARYDALYRTNKVQADEAIRDYALTLAQNEGTSNATAERKAKTPKKTTDPNAAKRPGSAFILFSQSERENIKREHPEATSSEIFKRLGEKWRLADADTKAHYDAIYRANKAKVHEGTLTSAVEPTAPSVPTVAEPTAPVASIASVIATLPNTPSVDPKAKSQKARKAKAPSVAPTAISIV